MSDEWACTVCGILPMGLAATAMLAWSARRQRAEASQAIAKLEASVSLLERRVRTLEAGTKAPEPPATATSFARPATPLERAQPVEDVVSAEQAMQTFRAPAAVPVVVDPEEPVVAPAEAASGVASPALAEAASFGGVATEPGVDAPAPASPAPPAPPVDVPGAAVPGDEIPPPAKPAFEGWEQWLGVRGAAAAGAIVLAIATIYFFRYSMDHGLLSPAASVGLGTLVGVACILGFEWRLRHTHRVLGEFLAGAGVIILYLTFWAARARFELIPSSVATVLMISVTAAACALSYVRGAVPVAVLGVVGGMATPMLLSTGQDRPIALFSYLVLLDGAFIVLARKRGWGWLALLCLGATFLYQLVWFSARLDPARMWLGVGIVAVFGVLFAFAKPREESNTGFRVVDAASVLLPAFFAMLFASTPKYGTAFAPTAVLLVFVTAFGAFSARREATRWLGPGAASAAVVSLAIRVGRTSETTEFAWQVAATLLALALVQVAFRELALRRPRPDEARPTVALDVVLVFGLLVEFGSAMRGSDFHLAAHAVALFGLVVLATVASVRTGGMARMTPVAVLASLVFTGAHLRHAAMSGYPSEAAWLAIGIGLALSLQAAPVAAAWRSGGGMAGRDASRWGDHGAAAAACILLFHGALHTQAVPTTGYLASLLLSLAFVASVAARRAHGGWLPVLVSVATVTNLAHEGRAATGTAEVLVALPIAALAIGFVPLVVGRAARLHPSTWRAAALAAPSVLIPVMIRIDEHVREGIRGVAPMVLAGLPLATLVFARRILPVDAPARRSATAWCAVAALSLVSIAIPAQVRNEWVTVGWALQGAAVIALHRRFDHAGIRVYAMGLFGLVFVRLVLNPAVLDYHAPSGLPVFNWLAYGYLVPAGAMLFAARELTIADANRPAQSATSPLLRAWHVPALSLAAIVIGFAWINLAVIDAFAVGRSLELPVDRRPARDLTISLAWALYAVGLLAVGMWKKNRPLRVTSLVMVLITCGKVFLYDLGALDDLYRVASLLGLALALIGVSAAYKKFVFTEDTRSS